MVNTRDRNVNAENSVTNNNVENNNTANSPLTLEQVLIMQAQMLQTMQHYRQEIDLETFSTPSRLLSLTPWNAWMPMTGSRL
jgi:hypothetical protein